jgi:hypothetical protein
MGMEKRTFYGPDIDIQALAHALVDHFSRDGHETQVMATSTGLMVQARKEATIRKIAGMSTALTTVLNMEGEYVAVELGGAKWADKGVAAGVGAIIFFPALITAGVGAFQQSQLQTKAWQFIEQYIRTNSAFSGSSFSMSPGGMGIPQAGGFGTPPRYPNQVLPGSQGPVGGYNQPAGPPAPVNMGGSPAAAGGASLCGQCNQVLPPGSKFCLACGAPASKTCFSCGQQLVPNARFCNGCGRPVGQ